MSLSLNQSLEVKKSDPASIPVAVTEPVLAPVPTSVIRLLRQSEKAACNAEHSPRKKREVFALEQALGFEDDVVIPPTGFENEVIAHLPGFKDDVVAPPPGFKDDVVTPLQCYRHRSS